MKKLTYVTQFFAALLLLMQFSSCDDLPAPEPVSEDNARPADVVNYGSPVMKDGVYINKPASSSNFRYAAAVIANANGSMDMWLSAPGGGYGEAEKWDTLNSVSGGNVAIGQLAAGGNGAIKATITEDFFSWGMYSPNWSNTAYTSARYKLYVWKDDYAATLKSEPIAEHEFLGYGDGVWLDLSTQNSGYFAKTGNTKFPAGTYLLYGERIEGNFGWWGNGRKNGVTYYVNGTERTENGQMNRVQYSVPSDFSYTDQISWRSAGVTDIHATWSADSLDIAPSEFGNDRTCAKEPSVVKIGEYYYMAYTGSYNQDDLTKDNSVFAARTKTLGDKSWEKWNGTGWGGETPEAIVKYDIAKRDTSKFYGAGEPSLVVKDNQVFLYYTYSDVSGIFTTRLAVAANADENWPAGLADKGVMLDPAAEGMANTSGANVKFIDELNRFHAIQAVNRGKTNSYIVVWESADGQTDWKQVATLSDNVRPNVDYPRYVSDEQGHVTADMKHMIVYNSGSNLNTAKLWICDFEFVK